MSGHRVNDVPTHNIVREGGLEPPRPCGHWHLEPARLPIPPLARSVCSPHVQPECIRYVKTTEKSLTEEARIS